MPSNPYSIEPIQNDPVELFRRALEAHGYSHAEVIPTKVAFNIFNALLGMQIRRVADTEKALQEYMKFAPRPIVISKQEPAEGGGE